MTINVDPIEVEKFSQLAHRWWDPHSEFKALHAINPLRLDYIDKIIPLAGKTVLDIGCGPQPVPSYLAGFPTTWIAGVSFGAWIGMQLLMRRPETDGFISVSPPTNAYDFSFLAPCPASGLILHGSADTVVPPVEVERVVSKLRTQKGIVIDYDLIEGANHFWAGKLADVESRVGGYLDKRLASDEG